MLFGVCRLPDESDGAFALVAQFVFVGVVDDVDISSLRQGTAFVGAVPTLVDAGGFEDLHAIAVEDGHAVVGEFLAWTVEPRTEDGDAFVVGCRGEGVGYPQDGVILDGGCGFGSWLLWLDDSCRLGLDIGFCGLRGIDGFGIGLRLCRG